MPITKNAPVYICMNFMAVYLNKILGSVIETANKVTIVLE